MNRLLLIFFLLLFTSGSAQEYYSGQVFMRENANLYLNQIFVTNLRLQKTILSNYNGEFKIEASAGDKIRFTSIISERKDVEVDAKQLANPMNFVELKPAYYEIQEVIIGWRPSGNLRKDVLSLKDAEKKLQIATIIGLPEPKKKDPTELPPIAGFQGGGLSFDIQSIYEVFSGDRKKKQRLYEYERMMSGIHDVRNYFGEEYFKSIKIPTNMIDNFLQFVYSSDNLMPYINNKNYEAWQIYIEKYLPIYQKRLRDSNLTTMALENT